MEFVLKQLFLQTIQSFFLIGYVLFCGGKNKN